MVSAGPAAATDLASAHSTRVGRSVNCHGACGLTSLQGRAGDFNGGLVLRRVVRVVAAALLGDQAPILLHHRLQLVSSRVLKNEKPDVS